MEQYISQVINECPKFKASSAPEPSRKYSISSMFKNLNEIVCIDHFYLDELILIHFMDSTTPVSYTHLTLPTIYAV